MMCLCSCSYVAMKLIHHRKPGGYPHYPMCSFILSSVNLWKFHSYLNIIGDVKYYLFISYIFMHII